MKIASTVFAALIVLSVSASAVTFGEPDLNRHPFVGTLLFETGTGWYSCTGTLMSPTVVLTAGHCTEEGGVPNLHTYVRFTNTVPLPLPPRSERVAFLDNPANGWVKGTAVPHPMYDDYAQFPRTYDVGVILLDTPVMTSTYGALPPEGFLQTIATKRSQTDNTFLVVGYGMQGFIPPFESDIWERYQGTVRLAEISSQLNAGQSAKFSNNPGIGGGSCYGDSGGPVFYGDTNMITAVVSWGKTPCIGNSYEFRVDTAVALNFLRPFLAAGAAPR